MISEESMMKDQYRRATHNFNSYEEEIEDANSYLNNIEEAIRQKVDILRQMQNNLEKMRASVQNASMHTMKLREEQEENTQRHPHTQFFHNESLNQNSNVCRSQARLNGLHFNGFNNFQQHQHHHYGDEQLLEGLPGDETMTRLFWFDNW